MKLQNQNIKDVNYINNRNKNKITSRLQEALLIQVGGITSKYDYMYQSIGF